MTWVALVWLVISTGSTRAVGGLVVAYTAPVIVGGLVMGALLDRFDRRRVLIVVNLVLGAAVASIPLLARADALETWHLFVVAAAYGLLKMANWAGVPAIVAALVPERDLTTANAMESISFGIADIAGPAIAGLLIAVVGGTNVLAVDAVSYLLFVAALLGLPRRPREHSEASTSRLALRPAFRFIRREPAVLATTLMFMAFNVGEGILLVVLPVFARDELGGGAATYGLLLSAFALAATAGAVGVGAVAWRWGLGRSIAVAQTAAGLSFLGLAFVGGVGGAMVVLAVAGLLTSPVTIWAQTIRMRLIPAELRGRVFGVLRTLMQSTPPVGGAIGGLLLAGDTPVAVAVAAMVLVMALPGVVGFLSPALAEDRTISRLPEEPAIDSPAR
jgi:MFS family permease